MQFIWREEGRESEIYAIASGDLLIFRSMIKTLLPVVGATVGGAVGETALVGSAFSGGGDGVDVIFVERLVL